MKISVFGTGYVGLVTATCLAKLGNDVLCFDIDRDKINDLNNLKVSIYEPGLTSLIKKYQKLGRLKFTNNPHRISNFSRVNFICVGTPQDSNGFAQLRYVYSAASLINFRPTKKTLVVIKSTVPPGTAVKLKEYIHKEKKIPFENLDVASNPEFLREGSAIKDFMHPNRIVVGLNNKNYKNTFKKIYGSLAKKLIFMGPSSSEMTKYASNIFLASKISLINEISNICEITGANIDEVKIGVGLDKRIGSAFLNPGPGYGGSCFPKDVSAMVKHAQSLNYDPYLIKSIEKFNAKQKLKVFRNLKSKLGDLKDKQILIWGAAFKAETDDIRESPTLDLLKKLISSKARIELYDPKAINNISKEFNTPLIKYLKNKFDCNDKVDALVIMTEWNEFIISPAKLQKNINTKLIIDARNLYKIESFKNLNIEYISFGRSKQ